VNKIIFLAVLMTSSMTLANRESGGRVAASTVYVKFNSIGTGIDSKTQVVLQKYIARAKKAKKISDYTYEQRGREGEAIYCVSLVTALDRVLMIKSLAPYIISDTKRIGERRTTVFVGTECRNIDSATEQDIGAYLKY